MSVETLPEYLNVSEGEQGDSLGIDFETYRHLARTALAIIREEFWTMGIYRHSEGCGLDIFAERICLTILVDVSENRLSLFVCPLDTPFAEALCLLQVGELRRELAQTPETGQRGGPLMKLSVNTILKGKFYSMGEEIPESIIPANIRQYALPAASPSRKEDPRHLNFKLNQPYRLDGEGYLRGSPSAQAAQMEAEASEEEQIVDDLAEGEVSETLAAAMEVARQELQAEVEVAKMNLRVKAEQADAIKDALRQEQDEQVERGDFDQFDSIPEELSRTSQDDPQARFVALSGGDRFRESRPRRSAKAKAESQEASDLMSDERRRFLLAAGREDLIDGEELYRHRAKSFGVAEKYIAFAKVRKETE